MGKVKAWLARAIMTLPFVRWARRVDDVRIEGELKQVFVEQGFEAACVAMVDEWETSARNAFRHARVQRDDFGKRFIEHGGVCYNNCAMALKRALVDRARQL